MAKKPEEKKVAKVAKEVKVPKAVGNPALARAQARKEPYAK